MISNVQKGNSFAESVRIHLKSVGHDIEPEYEAKVSVNGTHSKTHKFDLGNKSLLVECKAYDWTAGGNIPSAKLTTVNEAMLYFLGTPDSYRKMLFMSATGKRPVSNPETLAEYYVRTHMHLIPEGVEVYEFDPDRLRAERLWSNSAEPQGEPPYTQAASRPSGTQRDAGVGRVFDLKLWKTYYNQGFFNIPRAFDHLVGGERAVTLVLRGNSDIKGHVNRTANRNCTARVIGGARLCTWFQRNYSEGDTVPVRFDAPFRLILG